MALKMVMVLALSAFAIGGKLSQPPPGVRGQPRETTEKLPQLPRLSFFHFLSSHQFVAQRRISFNIDFLKKVNFHNYDR